MNVFTQLGKKVRNVFIGSSVIIGVLLALDFFYIQNKCTLENTVRTDKITEFNQQKPRIKFYCKTSLMIANIYNSLLVSIITLIFIELTLHPETIKEIKNIFNSSQSTRYIKSFYPNRKDYNDQIITKIRELKDDEEVKLLGLVKDIHILTTIDSTKIVEQIEKGCIFKVLLLYPSSNNLLLNCIQKSHPTLQYTDENFIKNEFNLFKVIANNLNKNPNLKGEIELRLQNSIYSPICYFSTKDNRSPKDFMAFIWMYMFNSKGLEYPAFEILDSQLLNDAEKHFDHLWSKSHSVLKYNNENKTNHLDELLNSNN